MLVTMGMMLIPVSMPVIRMCVSTAFGVACEFAVYLFRFEAKLFQIFKGGFVIGALYLIFSDCKGKMAVAKLKAEPAHFPYVRYLYADKVAGGDGHGDYAVIVFKDYIVLV